MKWIVQLYLGAQYFSTQGRIQRVSCSKSQSLQFSSIRYPLLCGPRQHGMRSLSHTSTHDQETPDFSIHIINSVFFLLSNYTEQKSHYPPANTMLSTSKNVLFAGRNHLLITGADDQVKVINIFKVSDHQHQWLAGGYVLEIGHV